MKSSRTPPSDPERMSAHDPELKRILHELADADAPSSAELRRMSQRLQVVFESPAPQQRMLLRARGAAGFAVIGGALLLASFGWLRVGQPRAADSDRSALTQPTPVENAPEISAAAPELAPAPSAPARQPDTARRPFSSNTKRHRTHAAALLAHSAAVSGEDSAGIPEQSASVSSSSSTVNPEPNASARSAAPAPLAPARAVSAQLDEAALLQQARQLAHSQPEAALRVLSEHQRRFANGMLSPEREVLAIELLHGLARNDDADKRLQAFRQRYPTSVYLKRFER